MDSRYTNREKYLDGLSNRDLAKKIMRVVLINSDNNGPDCEEFCPIFNRCIKAIDVDEECELEIAAWLGEKA